MLENVTGPPKVWPDRTHVAIGGAAMIGAEANHAADGGRA
jgi:hypothetical protein